jgi:hypothetical protein
MTAKYISSSRKFSPALTYIVMKKRGAPTAPLFFQVRPFFLYCSTTLSQLVPFRSHPASQLYTSVSIRGTYSVTVLRQVVPERFPPFGQEYV